MQTTSISPMLTICWIRYILEQTSLEYEYSPKTHLIKIQSPLPKVCATMCMHENSCLVTSFFPRSADPSNLEVLTQLSLFFNHLNFSMMGHNFTVDLTSGIIAIDSCFLCADCLPTREIVFHSIDVPVRFFRLFAGAIDRILDKKSTAKDEIIRADPYMKEHLFSDPYEVNEDDRIECAEQLWTAWEESLDNMESEEDSENPNSTDDT